MIRRVTQAGWYAEVRVPFTTWNLCLSYYRTEKCPLTLSFWIRIGPPG